MVRIAQWTDMIAIQRRDWRRRSLMSYSMGLSLTMIADCGRVSRSEVENDDREIVHTLSWVEKFGVWVLESGSLPSRAKIHASST